jgi:alkylation response protein AidB-like acyl-CoA dehydrogenase
METYFQRSINEIGRFYKFTDEDSELFLKVDKAAEELTVAEYESYLEREFDSKAFDIMKKYSLVGISIKKENGGLGATPIVATLASERLSQAGLGANSAIGVSTGLAGSCLESWGSVEQKRRYLAPAAKGEIILAYALTEPEAGSDPEALQATFEEKNGGYVLNGTKYLITNGSIADAVITFAYPKGSERQGMTAFIVDAKAEGYEVAMKLKEKLGFFTSDTAMIEFHDLAVPKENLLGIIGKGLWVAYVALISGRMGVASGCLGVIESCLSSVKERATNRWQHGKPIGKHQLIQQHIAEIAMNLEMARWPTYNAAFKIGDWEKSPLNKELRLDVDQASSIAKRVASRLAYESADRAVQVFGGFGYSTLSPVTKHFLDTRAARIFEGTDEIMDLKIASGVLGREFEAYK